MLSGLLLVACAASPAAAWTSGGLGIVYAGPYVASCPWVGCAPVPVYAQPVAWCPPLVPWPSWGPDVAVRWNRYFAPEEPRVRGYTLPR